MIKREEGIIVPPLNEDLIANLAVWVRDLAQFSKRKNLPILPLYEKLRELRVFGDKAHFEVVKDSDLGDDDARTYPDQGKILLRESVYDGAALGDPRARFTMGHELGHLVLHRDIPFARANIKSPPKIYQNSEWQADVFASHLLMPAPLLKGYMHPEDVMRDFSVSYSAANTRLRKLKEKGL